MTASAARDQTVSIRRACTLFGISRSWYYAARTPSRRDQDDARIQPEIEAIVRRHPAYGYRRVTAELRRRGHTVNHKRVLRLMRDHNLLCQLRSYVKTTRRNRGWTTTPNLVLGLAITRPDQVWAADITYIHTRRETGYLACIIDLWSRRILAHALSAEMTSALTEGVLQAATVLRTPAPGLIHHSDQGMQYANYRYNAHLTAIGARMSLSRVGRPTDNAIVESFFSTLKREEVWLNDYANLAEAGIHLDDFISQIYNHERLHSALGYRPPAEFEAAHGLIS